MARQKSRVRVAIRLVEAHFRNVHAPIVALNDATPRSQFDHSGIHSSVFRAGMTKASPKRDRHPKSFQVISGHYRGFYDPDFSTDRDTARGTKLPKRLQIKRKPV